MLKKREGGASKFKWFQDYVGISLYRSPFV